MGAGGGVGTNFTRPGVPKSTRERRLEGAGWRDPRGRVTVRERGVRTDTCVLCGCASVHVRVLGLSRGSRPLPTGTSTFGKAGVVGAPAWALGTGAPVTWPRALSSWLVAPSLSSSPARPLGRASARGRGGASVPWVLVWGHSSMPPFRAQKNPRPRDISWLLEVTWEPAGNWGPGPGPWQGDSYSEAGGPEAPRVSVTPWRPPHPQQPAQGVHAGTPRVHRQARRLLPDQTCRHPARLSRHLAELGGTPKSTDIHVPQTPRPTHTPARQQTLQKTPPGSSLAPPTAWLDRSAPRPAGQPAGAVGPVGPLLTPCNASDGNHTPGTTCPTAETGNQEQVGPAAPSGSAQPRLCLGRWGRWQPDLSALPDWGCHEGQGDGKKPQGQSTGHSLGRKCGVCQ